MYEPKYKITNQILKNIGIIEVCREVIENAPLVPAWKKRFQEEAEIRTIHYGTHLEGNDLTFKEANRVLEGQQVVGKPRDIQEIINYRRVLTYIETQMEISKYTPSQIKKIHTLTVDKIVDKKDCGQLRKTNVVLRNSYSGEVSFKPPDFTEVSTLLTDFLDWLNSHEARSYHPVIRAAITHYVLVAIHPFTEGNGRMARAFASLVLFSEGYDIKRFFSLEENFDRDSTSYFGSLMQVSNQSPKLEARDLTIWIEYFSSVLAIELTRIKEKVKKLSVDLKLKGRLGKQIALSERQMKLVEYLEEYNGMTVPEARKILPMVSDDTILRDLKDLVKKRIIKKEGKTKAARYIMK